MPLDVALDHDGRLVPWDPPQRRRVGRQAEVAVAALPARERVARDRIHLHLQSEEVVAALGAVPVVELLEEELGVEPLAHEASLHVRERGDHRVDGARLDVGPQLVDREHGATLPRYACTTTSPAIPSPKMTIASIESRPSRKMQRSWRRITPYA